MIYVQCSTQYPSSSFHDVPTYFFLNVVFKAVKSYYVLLTTFLFLLLYGPSYTVQL